MGNRKRMALLYHWAAKKQQMLPALYKISRLKNWEVISAWLMPNTQQCLISQLVRPVFKMQIKVTLFTKLQEGSQLHHHTVTFSLGRCEDYPLETAREFLIALKLESVPEEVMDFYFFFFFNKIKLELCQRSPVCRCHLKRCLQVQQAICFMIAFGAKPK